MNDQPKTRPISEDKPLDDLFPSRFLKPEQLINWRVTEITVEIARLQEEEVEPKPGQKEWKPVLYFKTKTGKIHPQGYLISAKVDKDSLKTASGAATIGELIGKKITIKMDQYRGRSVLRIDPNPPTENYLLDGEGLSHSYGPPPQEVPANDHRKSNRRG